MNFNEINKLWQNQREKYKSWRARINEASETLRNKMEEILQPPAEGWYDKEKQITYRYIEIIDIANKERPISRSFSPGSFTSEGELIFGIGIVFDYGVNTYPKRIFHIPVAIRFFNNTLEYSFFDTDLWEPSKSAHWEKDMDQFCQTIISEIVGFLNYDPLNGPQKKSSIGF